MLGFRVTAAAAGMKAERAWVRKDLAINFSSPVLVGQHLYGLGPKKKLFCLDIKTGKDAWVEDQRGGRPGGFCFAAGDEGQSLRVGRQRQGLSRCRRSAACRLISSTKVCGKNWCNPAYVDGKLLTRDHESLRCVELMNEAILDTPATCRYNKSGQGQKEM